MARKYSSSDTKQFINKHTENIKMLESASALLKKYQKNIQMCFSDMLSRNVFEQIVLNALNGCEENVKAECGALVRYLFLFKRATRQVQKCNSILRENRDRITSTIKEASAGKNAISWFFSSRKKKKNSEDACERLASDLEGSQYWTASQKVLSGIEENEGVSEDDSWGDYLANMSGYIDLLKKNLPDALQLPGPIRDVSKIVAQIEEVSGQLEKETNQTEVIRDNIKKAAEHMVMSTVLSILKNVPVEGINRGKRGFRVKALSDAGYTTMADLYAASVSQLALVHGISEDMAYSIKAIVKDFANEAKQNAKIKLSVDNKTKEATKLVSELHKYRKYISALDTYNQFSTEYYQQITKAVSDLKELGNGIFWIFYSDEKKGSVKESYAYLRHAISGDYSQRAIEITKMFQSAGASNTGSAWKDFQANSILFFNLLDEIVPGLLGNDDKLYGLPEELAREIQDECFFPEGLNCELRRYQEWGVKYILHQERVLLGDEMGLGKTVQAIATMVSLKNTGATHFLVVCPASVLPNWCKEISLKSKLRAFKVHGSERMKAIRAWMDVGGVAVTTYETTGKLYFEEKFKFDLMVVDEAHYIKNENAARSRNVRKIARYTKRLLFMTGTALENRVDEMISLIDVLQPQVAYSLENIAFMSTAPEFRKKVAGVYYRRKRDEVLTELPDLIESREWCTLSGEENALYEKELFAHNFMGIRRLSWNVDNLAHSCKAKRMMEIVEEAEGEGRKVLIFSFLLCQNPVRISRSLLFISNKR